MRKINFLWLVLFIIIFFSMTTSAGVEDDISYIKRELSQIKRDVIEIKNIIKKVSSQQRPSLPTEAEVSIDDDPMLGDKRAEVAIIEFSDYQCPYCSRFAREVFPELKRQYVNTGKIRYVFRDFPLPMHRFAKDAAEAANCADDQGRYWDMHDKLFENSNRLNEEVINEIIKKLRLNMNKFNKCRKDKKYKEEVLKDINDGIKATIKGTPSFIIGKVDSAGKVNGKIIRGAMPFYTFKAEIDRLLR